MSKIFESKEYYNTEFKHRFSNQFRNLRKERDLTAEELSSLINEKPSRIYALELGDHKDWNLILKLGRFYKKRVKIDFY